MEYRLAGYIGSDNFTNRTNSHFVYGMTGKVACKSKCRFGYDTHTVIKFISLNEFYTDDFKTRPKRLYKNHLPLTNFVTCEKCRDKIDRIISRVSRILKLWIDHSPGGYYYQSLDMSSCLIIKHLLIKNEIAELRKLLR